MLDILKRFDLAESGASKLTPVNVKHGLNKQQKAVGQVGPEFKPKTTKVLTAPTDPKNPFAGKLVGGSESRENNRPVLEDNNDRVRQIAQSMYDGEIDWQDFVKLAKSDSAAKMLKKAADEIATDVYAEMPWANMSDVVEEIINRLWKKFVNEPDLKNNNITEAEVSEDLLSDIKKSLNDYLKQIDTIEKVDSDLKNKDRKDTDLKKKDKRDRDFIIRKVKEDPTQQNPVVQPKAPGLINPTYADSGASQTPTVNTDVAQNLQTVGESLNEPYELDLEENHPDYVSFFATTDDSADRDPVELTVRFSRDEDDEWEIEFGANGQYGVTNKGDAFRIFATVTEAIEQFLQMPQGRIAETIYFTAKEPSRVKLYDRMAKLMSKVGFRRVPTSHGWMFKFQRSVAAQPALESLKTMKCHNGKVFEIFGDEKSGFGVRHNGKFSPSRFRTFLEADTALELFANRLKQDSDYKTEL
jgi:hypothetical protein